MLPHCALQPPAVSQPAAAPGVSRVRLVQPILSVLSFPFRAPARARSGLGFNRLIAALFSRTVASASSCALRQRALDCSRFA